MSLKHYVEFFYPGMLVAESKVESILNRDQDIKLPRGSYGYGFFDREEVEKDGEILRGKTKNYSGMYFKGRKMSLAEVKEKLPKERTLITNMESNGYTHVVKTKSGWFQPFQEGKDIILGG